MTDYRGFDLTGGAPGYPPLNGYHAMDDFMEPPFFDSLAFGANLDPTAAGYPPPPAVPGFSQPAPPPYNVPQMLPSPLPPTSPTRRSASRSPKASPAAVLTHFNVPPTRSQRARTVKAQQKRSHDKANRKYECTLPKRNGRPCGHCPATKSDAKRHCHQTHHQAFEGIEPPTFPCPRPGCPRQIDPFYRESNLDDHLSKMHPDAGAAVAFAGHEFVPMQIAPSAGCEDDDEVDDARRLEEVMERQKAFGRQFKSMNSEIRVLQKRVQNKRKAAKKTGGRGSTD